MSISDERNSFCAMYHRLILFAFLGGVLSSLTGEVQGDSREDVSFILPSSRIAGDSRLTGLQFNVTTPVPAGPGHNLSCEDYHKLNSSAEKCEFIRTSDDCHNSDGFINYLKVIYCSFPDVRPLGFVCLGLWLIYLLITLGVTAEDFFCPNLKVMARTLKLSQNIAGVTLLAFGNGAPDIFTFIAAITKSRNGKAGLAIGALFGAGIFVTTMVAGSIAISRPFKMVERPFLRDAIFYLGAAFWTFYILYKGSIRLLEAIGYILLYLLYVSVVIVGRRIYQHQKRRRQEQEQAVETTHTPETQERIQPTGGEFSATERLAVASILGVDEDVVRRITPLPHHTSDHDINDNESQPLLRGEAPPPGQVKEFFIGLCPVDLKEWAELVWYLKIWELMKCPMLICLKATVPVVDYNEPKHNWNRLLNTLNLFLAPVFCAFVTKGLTQTITGGFVVWHLVLPVSFLLAAAVFLTSKPKKQPVYHAVFSYVGFVVAVLWIYSTVNEIVNILQMFGVEFFINDAILGLTVLAWGNSVGDLVADVAMAKQGFPITGMSACFGGPMFNMLLGVGVSCAIVTVGDGGTFVMSIHLACFIMPNQSMRRRRFFGRLRKTVTKGFRKLCCCVRASTDDERPVAVTVDDIALFHLVSGASTYEITTVEENGNIDTKPQLVVPSAVSDDDGYDDDNLSSISDWSSLFDESDDDDDMSSFTTVSELSNFTWDLFEETKGGSTMDLSFCAVDDDVVDTYTIAQMLLEQLLYEIV